MFYKVMWVTVVVFVILPEKDMAKAQNTDLANAESRAWRRSDILDPTDLPTNMQPPSEDFNQEPMRRRRRKRKRRPQQQQQQQDSNYPLGDADRMNYWHGEVDDEPDPTNGGITVMVNGVKGIQNVHTEVWHEENDRPRVNYPNNPNKNEFVQEMVMQVEGPADNARQDDATNKSYRKPYVVAKKDDGSGDSAGSDLKNLLKNSGGLSLSEILQKQNLSLDDLLKGKQNAFKVLQNTAAPTPTENILDTKGVRRIPSAKRPASTVVSTEQVDLKSQMTDENKQTRRLPNFVRPKSDVATVDTVVKPEETKHLTVTLSDFMVPPSPADNKNHGVSVKPNIYETVTIASTNLRGANVNRRLPANNLSEKNKPIKEVVSRIRPDLSNSNSRRRLLPIKLRSNSVNTTAPTNTRLDSKERLPLRYGNAPKVGSAVTVNKTKVSTESSSVPTEVTTDIEIISSTQMVMSSTTTTIAPVTQASREVVKDIVKSRLALKPRLKIPQLLPNPTTATTTTTSTTTTTTTAAVPSVNDSTDIESTEQFASSESSDEIETSTAYPNDENLSEDEEEKLLFSSEDELKDILDKSEPEINSILEEFALYNGRKSVVPIEDLFEDSQGTEQDVFRAFTSRSDKMPVTDRTKEMQNSYQHGNSKMMSGKVDVTERNPSLFSDITSIRTTDDKTDILELLDDRRSGARLTKVLEQRNMTLEELLEHRKRGSSQLHLSEIVNNKTRPLTEVNAADKLDIVTAFENFPNFNLPNIKSVRPDDVRTDSDGSSYFTSIINIKPTDEISKEGRSLKQNEFIKPASPTNQYPHWKTMGYPPQDVNYIDSMKKNIISSSRISPFEEDEVLQIEKEVALSHDFVDLELSGHGFKPNSVSVENATIPVGVRSAIIASASIVGVCLMIFILIFATCRWRQKQRKKLNYSENFQTVRGRLPILARNSTSSSSTKRSQSPNVFTTMGSRSSKLNTMDPNSPEVQEYLYDAMRKSFR